MPAHWSGSVLQRRREAPAHNLLGQIPSPATLSLQKPVLITIPHYMLSNYFISSHLVIFLLPFCSCIMSLLCQLFTVFPYAHFVNDKTFCDLCGVRKMKFFTYFKRRVGNFSTFLSQLWAKTLVKWLGLFISFFVH